MSDRPLHSIHISLVALPDAVVSTLAGIYDVMNSVALLGTSATAFQIEIVGEQTGLLMLASGIPFTVQRAITDVNQTDIVIVPSILLQSAKAGVDNLGEQNSAMEKGEWKPNRYPQLVEWLRSMHKRGAIICSACSGVFLLAETGFFDGHEATVHFGYANAFSAIYPEIKIHPEQVLVISGAREELICSGASMSWHDLVLYLIARFAGATVAQEIARMFALQWHQEGLAPYIVFSGKQDHGDAEIKKSQDWLVNNFSAANAVDELIRQSRLAERTFKRRFTAATGLAPIAYIQRLRIEDAKRRLERTEASIDEISWRVGYEDAAFFRRLFKRTTGMTPGAYRKRFCIPGFVY